MQKIVDLKDLMIEQLRDLYDSEDQQLAMLETLAQKASTIDLEEIIQHHLRETRHQQQRLVSVFEQLQLEPGGETCEGMQGIIKETRQLIKRATDDEVTDAAIITAIQHINHYEIAGYGTAISYAKALKMDEVAETLLETLREEKRADNDLSELAESQINPRATFAKS